MLRPHASGRFPFGKSHGHDVKRCKCQNYQKQPLRLPAHELDQRFRILKKVGRKMLSPYAQISEDRTRNRRADDRPNTKHREIHPHNTGGDGDQMPDAGQKPREKNAPGLIAREPVLRFLQFLRRK